MRHWRFVGGRSDERVNSTPSGLLTSALLAGDGAKKRSPAEGVMQKPSLQKHLTPGESQLPSPIVLRPWEDRRPLLVSDPAVAPENRQSVIGYSIVEGYESAKVSEPKRRVRI